MDAPAMETWHRYIQEAGSSAELYSRVGAAITGCVADQRLLTVFGAWSDYLHFHPRWRALFPNAVQRVITRGNHFPMCDDPHLVATWIREWHATTVVSGNTGLKADG